MTGARADLVGFADTEKMDRHALGERLRQSRDYLGLSQDEVAKYLGIPRSALSNIENGQRKIDFLELQKLAKLYKQPVSYFTGETQPETGLPQDVAHLARAAVKLSQRDREELNRFAEYLKARSEAEESSNA